MICISRCFEISRADQKHYGGKNYQKTEIEQGKFKDVASRFVRIVAYVLTEGDQAREGRDERTDTADIDSDKKLAVIFCELREQDGGRYVTYKLTGHDAEDQSAFFEQGREKVAHDIDPCHISRKDEEENKGQQKTVVDFFQGFSVNEDQNGGNYDQTDPKRDPAKHDRYGEREKDQIQNGFLWIERDLFVLQLKRLGLYENATTKSDQRDREQKGKKHYRNEFSRWDIVFCVKIKILRISEGREHSAEVSRDILHNEGKSHIFLLSRRGKYKISERQKGQQRHIVRDQHRADKGYVDQRKNAHFGIFKASDDLFCQDIKEMNIFQRAHDSQDAKKTGERFIIEITEIFLVDRDDETCDYSGKKRDKHHGVLFDKGADIREMKRRSYGGGFHLCNFFLLKNSATALWTAVFSAVQSRRLCLSAVAC